MNGILLLRLVLAGLVILAHSWWVLLGSDAEEPGMRLTRGERNSGALAVDGFFVLSGMLVTASWLRSRSFVGYLTKRILRIFPGFLGVCLFQAYVLVPGLAGDWRPILSLSATGQVLLFALTLGGAGREIAPGYTPFADQPFTQLNASLWTIRPEFLCYLLLAALGGSGLLGRSVVRWSLLGVCVALFALQPDWEWHEYLKGVFGTFWYWPRFLAYFLAGVCLHYSGDRFSDAPRVSRLLAAGLLAATLHPVTLRIALPLLGSWLLRNLTRSLLLTRLSARLPGDFSYGIYLYGFPCQQLLVFLTGTNWNPYLFAVAAFLITLIPATLSWRWIEKPFLDLKPALVGGTTRSLESEDHSRS